MGMAALLGALTVIIVILGFITSLQNRFRRPERGGRGDHQSLRDGNDDVEEEKHASSHDKKRHASQHHRERRPARREDESSHQEVKRRRKERH